MISDVGQGPTLRSAIIWLLLAAAVALVPIPSSLVYTVYSTRLYAVLQPPVTSLSNSAPFVLLDVLVGMVIAGHVALTLRDVLSHRMYGAWIALKRTAIWVSVLYILFAAVWGFNYRRRPIAQRVEFDERAVTADAAVRLAGVAVDRLNALHATAHQNGWRAATSIDPALAEPFGTVVRDLSHGRPVVVGRPKRSVLLHWYFERAGV